MSADILLTGADGQLGWEIQRRAKAAGRTLQAFNRAGLDITSADAVRRAVDSVKPKVIVNAAAYTAVDKAESDQAAAFAVNRDGPALLAAACAKSGAAIIHISTDYVFDGTKQGPYAENDPVAPLGAYGASKLAGEEAVKNSGARHVILRTAWVHGIRGHNFVKTMLRLGRERDALRVVDDQHGAPTFAGDLAGAVLGVANRLVANAPADGYGVFHCTGQGATTWCAFARKIFEIAAPKLGKVPTVAAITTAEYPTPAKRPANSVLDCGKLTRIYGITLRPWQDALAEMLGAVLAADAQAAKGP